MGKTANVYKAGDRYYVSTISECVCNGKYDDAYVLDCRIKERGDKRYSCSDDPAYIQRFLETKRLWLTDEARKQVNETIRRFNSAVAEAKGNSFTSVPIKECQVTLYYRHLEGEVFDFLLEFDRAGNMAGNQRFTYLLRQSSLHAMFRELNWNISGNDDMITILRESTMQTIEKNPVYKSAVDGCDLTMQRLIKLHYRIADAEDCEALSKDIFGRRILPSLPKEYNRSYVVDSASIEVDLLNNSGYRILHRPYFGMPGNTHSKWQLNPFTKAGIDCGPVGAEAMMFEDYLDLFRENGYKADA